MTRNKIMPKTNNNSKITRTGWHPIDVAALERMKQPDYHQKSRGLAWNATPTDKTKYEICQSILWYVHENKLSDQDLKKTLGIKEKKKLECLLFTHIDTFNLDELGEYSIRLFGDFKLRMLRPGEEIHSISQSKTNGRSQKQA